MQLIRNKVQIAATFMQPGCLDLLRKIEQYVSIKDEKESNFS